MKTKIKHFLSRHSFWSLVFGAWSFCAAVFHADAQPAIIPSAYLKTRFNQFTNAITTNSIGGTNAGGVAVGANSAVQFATLGPGGSNWTMVPLNRARGIAVFPWIQGTNLTSATNIVTWNFTVSYDGTNFVTPGPGGIGPFAYTQVASGSNVVAGFGSFGVYTGYSPGPFVNGVLAGVPGGTNVFGAGNFWSPVTQWGPLDNAQYILLLSVTNIGSQPVWLHTNGVWFSQYP